MYDEDADHDRWAEDRTDWEAVKALGGFATMAQIAAYRKSHPSAD